MTEGVPAEPQPQLAIELPPEVEVGIPADFASLWQTDTSFVIDFCVNKHPPQLATDDNGQQVIVVPAKVCARVRIPPEQVFELARALTQQLDNWELKTGRKKPYDGPPLPGSIN